MYTLLISFLACLVGIQATEAGQPFERPVTVQFVIKDREHTAINSRWTDCSQYESPELKSLDTTPEANGDVIGSLVFHHAKGLDERRVFTWSNGRIDLQQCTAFLIEDPNTPIMTIELSSSSSKVFEWEGKGFLLSCEPAQIVEAQSAV